MGDGNCPRYIMSASLTTYRALDYVYCGSTLPSQAIRANVRNQTGCPRRDLCLHQSVIPTTSCFDDRISSLQASTSDKVVQVTVHYYSSLSALKAGIENSISGRTYASRTSICQSPHPAGSMECNSVSIRAGVDLGGDAKSQ